jgi:hypothetical protein
MPTAARRDHTAAVSVTLIGLAGVVVAAFLPWLASGRVERNSFDTVRSAERLGVAEARWQELLLDAWYLLPLLGALALAAMVLHRPALAAWLALAAGAIAAVVGIMVVGAPVSSRSGPIVAIGMGVLTVGGALWLLRVERQRS